MQPGTDEPQHALSGGGEMGALMRAIDWSGTDLGPVTAWPQSLKTTVSVCLSSRFPMLIWWGPQMVMLYNDAYRAIIASKHPTAMGQRGRECFPEIWHIIGPMLAGVLERGEATWSADQLLTLARSGYLEECYFTFSYSPIRDESGGIGGVFTAVTETTEQVLSARRLRTLSELATAAVHGKSLDATCRAAAEVLGRNASDLPFALLYRLEEDGAAARLVASSGLEPGGPASPELVRLDGAPGPWPLAEACRGGGARVVALEGALAELPGGPWPAAPQTALVLPLARPGADVPPEGVLVAGISPRRALDAAYRDFLELVAGQTAAALAGARAYEEERRRAEALAELDRAKTTFFSNVSHEFRTPLTLVLAPLEDLLAGASGALAPSQRQTLETAHRNALRLLRLVNTLLDFSRLEAGRIEACYEPVELGAYTAELASVFRSAVERAGLAFTIDCPATPEPVYVDRDMWEKIVLNLLSNAHKFTFEGEIRVSLRATEEGVVLEVADTGTGIPAPDLPHVFERFRRVEGSRSRTHEGTGIGLALVHELAGFHGGTVRVESREGVGSRFTVQLPLGSAHLPPDRIRARRGSGTGLGAAFLAEAERWVDADEAGGDAHPPGAARILLADDNADMREYVERVLADRWSVEAVGDGEAALAAARRRRPDLVLADIMMPRLDGFELLAALRADPELKAVPVVLLSARAGEEARVEGLEAGADDYLVKPFSRRELVARVAAHLEMARVRDETALLQRSARERAEEASATKSQFLATVSHELRTPLNAILGYVDLLAEQISGPLNDVQQLHLSRVRRGAQHLLQIIETILSFSRLEAGKEEISPEPTDLAALAREAATLVDPLARQKGLELRLSLPRGPVSVFTDPAKLHQVLLNLLSNAVKFTARGSVELGLECDQGVVRLRVADTGPGIPATELERIFEPFRQVPGTHGRGGTGLGLTVTRQLARLLGGDVAVQSTPGAGSTFTVTLPLQASAPALLPAAS